MAHALRTAVVGGGEESRRLWIPAALEADVEYVAVVGLVDPDPELAGRVSRSFGVSPLPPFINLANLAGTVKVDGVVVALPREQQREAILEALRLGLRVFSAGPLGSSAEEAREIIEAARQAELPLAAGSPYRQLAGSSLSMANLAEIFDLSELEVEWRRIARPAGGWADLAAEALWATLPLLGAPVRVVARLTDRGEGFGMVRMTAGWANGLSGHFTLSWGGPDSEDKLFVRIGGNEATIEAPLMAADLDPEDFRSTRIDPNGTQQPGPPPTPLWRGCRAQLGDWARAGRQEEVSARPWDGLAVVAVTEAAAKSIARDGAEVYLAQGGSR